MVYIINNSGITDTNITWIYYTSLAIFEDPPQDAIIVDIFPAAVEICPVNAFKK
jgi:hypothetical protein